MLLLPPPAQGSGIGEVVVTDDMATEAAASTQTVFILASVN
jgi:hypothetical protein